MTRQFLDVLIAFAVGNTSGLLIAYIVWIIYNE